MALPVVIVGAGPAGLAVSRELQVRNVDHVVLEQARLAQAWRDRWDSFTLVTPNWTLALPGYDYGGDDPQGHVPKSDIVAYLEHYAREMAGPVHEGVRVERLELAADGAYRSHTSDGVMTADTVVVCTGAYQRTYRPAAFEGISHFDAMSYRSPEQLPAGPVLVVGSGQTGCQIAEELVLAGRDVFLSCGRATWVPRRIAGTDSIDWLLRVGFFEHRLADLPSPAARLASNLQATGAKGGHDLHFRVLQALGVGFTGRVAGVDGRNRALR